MKYRQTPLNLEEVAKFKRYLSEQPRIMILAHANPDGDAIGATAGLYAGLKSAGHNVAVGCIDGVPNDFQFITQTDQYVTDFETKDYDAIIFTDCGSKHMTKFQESKPEILSEQMVKINIDHHASNDNFGEINFVYTDRASASMIVFEILQALQIKINPPIATALLTGIYTDTGSFMHQNTTPLTYQMASELIKLGGSPTKISRAIFKNYEFKTLKLWGRVLENLHVTKEGAAIVGVAESDYASLGCTREDLAGVIDFINSMPEAEYSVLLSEDGKGNVKASLRTRKEDIDVKALAEKYGGGGHIKAAGFSIPGGRLEKEVKWKIVQD